MSAGYAKAIHFIWSGPQGMDRLVLPVSIDAISLGEVLQSEQVLTFRIVLQAARAFAGAHAGLTGGGGAATAGHPPVPQTPLSQLPFPPAVPEPANAAQRLQMYPRACHKICIESTIQHVSCIIDTVFQL